MMNSVNFSFSNRRFTNLPPVKPSLQFQGVIPPVTPLVAQALERQNSGLSEEERLNNTQREALALFTPYANHPEGLMPELEKRGLVVRSGKDYPWVNNFLDHRDCGGVAMFPEKINYPNDTPDIEPLSDKQLSFYSTWDGERDFQKFYNQMQLEGKIAFLVKDPDQKKKEDKFYKRIDPRYWIIKGLEQAMNYTNYWTAKASIFHEAFHVLQALNGLPFGMSSKTDFAQAQQFSERLHKQGAKALGKYEQARLSERQKQVKQGKLKVAQTGPGAALRTIAKREMEAHQFIMEYCGKLGLSRVAYWDARLNYKNYERDYQYSYLLDSSEG